MNYRKTFNYTPLFAWNTIAVFFFMCSITLNNAEAKFLFKARMDYGVGSGPKSVALGDMNQDGNLDLVGLVSEMDTTVQVLLGNGDGTFQSGCRTHVANSDGWRGVLAIGDLNGDGDPDLAAVHNYSTEVWVLLGNGDCTFEPAVNYSVSAQASSVAIGDLDGDDNLDLVTNGVSVLLGNGDGTFQSAVNFSAEGEFVALEDLDGDGNLDLVTEGVSVLLGNGDGSFHIPVSYTAGESPSSVAIDDLNGDGNPDLAVANHSSDNVSVLLGNGDGTFQTAVNYNAGIEPSFVVIGDLDKDDDLDMVVANWSSNNVSVLLGNGDGTFQAAVNYGVGYSPLSVAIGDLDKDSDLDMAVANGNSASVSELLGNGDGTFDVAVNYGAGVGPWSVAIGDLDKDDDLDMVVANGGSDNVSVLLGNGDGTFQTAVNYTAGDNPRSVAIDDLNGDGNTDLAVANWLSDNVSVLLGNGDGTFQTAVNYTAGDRPRSVAIGDLDEDGDLDLSVANEESADVSVLLGNGDGTFQAAVNHIAGDEPQSIAIGDLNEDDDLDLVLTNGDYWYVSVLLGNGDGSFQSAVDYDTGGYCNFVAISDLNGDGDLDLVTDYASVLLGKGDGTFQTAVNFWGGRDSVAIGDLDGDSYPDLAFGYGGSITNYSISVRLGNGDGTFQARQNYGVGSWPGSVAIGDLYKDGDLDLAAANGDSNNVSILINTGEVAKLSYSPAAPCRIVDTRKAGGILGASTQRNFHVYGDGATISAQGGNSAGCSAPMGEPLAAHINMIAVNPIGKGNLQAFPVGAGTGAGLSVNYNAIDTNLANAGTVKTVTGSGPDITVASNFSSAHAVIDVLGYYYPDEGFYYTPVDPCRIVDTRKTTAGIIDASTQRDFRVSGPVGDQGGNPAGCPSTLAVHPEAAHLNMVAVDPTGKGNLQAFPVGSGTGAGLSVNYNTIDTNLANAGTVKTSPDISVVSNFSSAHTVIDVLGYYYPEGDLLYAPVSPCRIIDTRNTSAGIIGVSTQRDFYVYGSGSIIGSQGGNFYGCPSPLGEPLAAHINMVAVNPTGKGNLQAFPVGAGAGAGLSVNYNTIDTNLANGGTVRAISGTGPDITVASNFSSSHTVIDVLGYFYPEGDLLYAPVTPCRIIDTRNTSAGIIGVSTQRNFRVFGSGGTISAQGGNPGGCPSPLGEPLAAHINMVAVNPTGKGNLQAFPVGAGTGAGLSVNYNTIDTNLANAGTVKTVTGVGADITVASNFSSAHTVIDVLGYYYPAP